MAEAINVFWLRVPVSYMGQAITNFTLKQQNELVYREYAWDLVEKNKIEKRMLLWIYFVWVSSLCIMLSQVSKGNVLKAVAQNVSKARGYIIYSRPLNKEIQNLCNLFLVNVRVLSTAFYELNTRFVYTLREKLLSAHSINKLPEGYLDTLNWIEVRSQPFLLASLVTANNLYFISFMDELDSLSKIDFIAWNSNNDLAEKQRKQIMDFYTQFSLDKT
jgi:hypothetical protein